ncbi:MAG TPA: histidine kinase [Streptosporangiaceae bacterium]
MNEREIRMLDDDTRADIVLALDRYGHVRGCGAGARRLGRSTEIVGEHLSRFAPPEDADSGAAERLLRKAAAHGTHGANRWWVRTDGSRLWADTLVTATFDATGEVIGFVIVMREVTRHWQRMAELAAVAEATRTILTGRPGDEILALVVRRMRELTGAASAIVLSLDWDGTLTTRAADGPWADALYGLKADGGELLALDVIRGGRPRMLRKISGWPRRAEPADADADAAGLATAMFVPLPVDGRRVGVAALAGLGRRFTRADLRAVELLADPAALAVERAWCDEDVWRLAENSARGRDALRSALDSLAARAVDGTDSTGCAVHLLTPWPYNGDSKSVPPAAVGSYGKVPTNQGPLPPVCRRLVIERQPPASASGRAGTAGGVVVRLPLLHWDQRIGELRCYYPGDRRRPDDREIGFLKMIADLAAASVTHGRLWIAAQQKAAMEERQRLSRELHDSINQALYGIKLDAGAARELLDRDAAKAVEPIEHVLDLAEGGLSEIRGLIFNLRREPPDAQGLVAALARQAELIRVRHGIATETLLGPEPAASPQAKRVLYRVVEEALHNAAKHSGARQVTLRLFTGPGTITAVVTDDGKGFEPDQAFPGHLGLRSMRERIAAVGGDLDVESRPGRGTKVRATVPPGVE